MPRHASRAALLVTAILVFAGRPASAQDRMAEGTWTGIVVPPEEMVVDLEYLVSYGEGGLEITLVPPPDLGMDNVPAVDIFHDGETLVFTIDVGSNVQCTLFREEDGTFEGECVDEIGEGGFMTMVPPAGGS